LIAAMGDTEDGAADPVSLAMMRRALVNARAACDAAGVEVETAFEASERQRLRDEALIHGFAAEQTPYRSRLSRAARLRLAAIGGAGAGGAALAVWPDAFGLAFAVPAAALAFVTVRGLLWRAFPTAGVRVARLAAQVGAGFVPAFPPESDDGQDYAEAYRALTGRDTSSRSTSLSLDAIAGEGAPNQA